VAFENGARLGRYEVLAPMAREKWERSTLLSTPCSTARWRSRSRLRSWPMIVTAYQRHPRFEGALEDLGL